MACGFCSRTPVDVCPICQTASGPRKPPVQAPKVATLDQAVRAVQSAPKPLTTAPVNVATVTIADPSADPSALLADMLNDHKPAPVKASPPPPSFETIIKEARKLWVGGARNASVMLLTALAGGPLATYRKAIIQGIDANGAARGCLSAADEKLRLSILGDVTRELGIPCKAVPQQAPMPHGPVEVTQADLDTARDMLASL